jgi:hypothetical protein
MYPTKSKISMESDDTAEEFWNTSVAAQYLNEQLSDRTVEQWGLWLQNNRNQSRKASFRIPITRIANGAFYRPEDLATFSEFEKSRQLGTLTLSGRSAEALRAFGIGTASGSTTGRKLDVTSISQQTDRATGEQFVQFATNDPLMVYRLSPDQAIDVATKLMAAAKNKKA